MPVASDMDWQGQDESWSPAAPVAAPTQSDVPVTEGPPTETWDEITQNPQFQAMSQPQQLQALDYYKLRSAPAVMANAQANGEDPDSAHATLEDWYDVQKRQLNKSDILNSAVKGGLGDLIAGIPNAGAGIERQIGGYIKDNPNQDLGNLMPAQLTAERAKVQDQLRADASSLASLQQESNYGGQNRNAVNPTQAAETREITQRYADNQQRLLDINKTMETGVAPQPNYLKTVLRDHANMLDQNAKSIVASSFPVPEQDESNLLVQGARMTGKFGSAIAAGAIASAVAGPGAAVTAGFVMNHGIIANDTYNAATTELQAQGKYTPEEIEQRANYAVTANLPASLLMSFAGEFFGAIVPPVSKILQNPGFIAFAAASIKAGAKTLGKDVALGVGINMGMQESQNAAFATAGIEKFAPGKGMLEAAKQGIIFGGVGALTGGLPRTILKLPEVLGRRQQLRTQANHYADLATMRGRIILGDKQNFPGVADLNEAINLAATDPGGLVPKEYQDSVKQILLQRDQTNNVQQSVRALIASGSPKTAAVVAKQIPKIQNAPLPIDASADPHSTVNSTGNLEFDLLEQVKKIMPDATPEAQVAEAGRRLKEYYVGLQTARAQPDVPANVPAVNIGGINITPATEAPATNGTDISLTASKSQPAVPTTPEDLTDGGKFFFINQVNAEMPKEKAPKRAAEAARRFKAYEVGMAAHNEKVDTANDVAKKAQEAAQEQAQKAQELVAQAAQQAAEAATKAHTPAPVETPPATVETEVPPVAQPTAETTPTTPAELTAPEASTPTEPAPLRVTDHEGTPLTADTPPSAPKPEEQKLADSPSAVRYSHNGKVYTGATLGDAHQAGLDAGEKMTGATHIEPGFVQNGQFKSSNEPVALAEPTAPPEPARKTPTINITTADETKLRQMSEAVKQAKAEGGTPKEQAVRSRALFEAAQAAATKAAAIDAAKAKMDQRIAEAKARQGTPVETTKPKSSAVMLHGTPNPDAILKEGFNSKAGKPVDHGELGTGIYLTPHGHIAKNYTGLMVGKGSQSGGVLEVHVDTTDFAHVEDPYFTNSRAHDDVSRKGPHVKEAVTEHEKLFRKVAYDGDRLRTETGSDKAEASNEIREAFLKAGYKGITTGHSGEMVIFDPSAIKSTKRTWDENRYDLKNPAEVKPGDRIRSESLEHQRQLPGEEPGGGSSRFHNVTDVTPEASHPESGKPGTRIHTAQGSSVHYEGQQFRVLHPFEEAKPAEPTTKSVETGSKLVEAPKPIDKRALRAQAEKTADASLTPEQHKLLASADAKNHHLLTPEENDAVDAFHTKADSEFKRLTAPPKKRAIDNDLTAAIPKAFQKNREVATPKVGTGKFSEYAKANDTAGLQKALAAGEKIPVTSKEFEAPENAAFRVKRFGIQYDPVSGQGFLTDLQARAEAAKPKELVAKAGSHTRDDIKSDVVALRATSPEVMAAILAKATPEHIVLANKAMETWRRTKARYLDTDLAKMSNGRVNSADVFHEAYFRYLDQLAKNPDTEKRISPTTILNSEVKNALKAANIKNRELDEVSLNATPGEAGGIKTQAEESTTLADIINDPKTWDPRELAAAEEDGKNPQVLERKEVTDNIDASIEGFEATLTNDKDRNAFKQFLEDINERPKDSKRGHQAENYDTIKRAFQQYSAGKPSVYQSKLDAANARLGRGDPTATKPRPSRSRAKSGELVERSAEPVASESTGIGAGLGDASLRKSEPSPDRPKILSPADRTEPDPAQARQEAARALAARDEQSQRSGGADPEGAARARGTEPGSDDAGGTTEPVTAGSGESPSAAAVPLDLSQFSELDRRMHENIHAILQERGSPITEEEFEKFGIPRAGELIPRAGESPSAAGPVLLEAEKAAKARLTPEELKLLAQADQTTDKARTPEQKAVVAKFSSIFNEERVNARKEKEDARVEAVKAVIPLDVTPKDWNTHLKIAFENGEKGFDTPAILKTLFDNLERPDATDQILPLVKGLRPDEALMTIGRALGHRQAGEVGDVVNYDPLRHQDMDSGMLPRHEVIVQRPGLTSPETGVIVRTRVRFRSGAEIEPEDISSSAQHTEALREDRTPIVVAGYHETPEFTPSASARPDIAGFKGTSDAKVAARMSADKITDPVARALAQKIAELIPNGTKIHFVDDSGQLKFDNGNTASMTRCWGAFHARSGTIFISDKVPPEFLDQAVLHESVHAALDAFLKSDRAVLDPTELAARQNFARAYWNALQGYHKVKNPEAWLTYATSSQDEFAAAIVSDPRFQKWVRGDSVTKILTSMLGPTGDLTSPYERAMETILKLDPTHLPPTDEDGAPLNASPAWAKVQTFGTKIRNWKGWRTLRYRFNNVFASTTHNLGQFAEGKPLVLAGEHFVDKLRARHGRISQAVAELMQDIESQSTMMEKAGNKLLGFNSDRVQRFSEIFRQIQQMQDAEIHGPLDPALLDPLVLKHEPIFRAIQQDMGDTARAIGMKVQQEDGSWEPFNPKTDWTGVLRSISPKIRQIMADPYLQDGVTLTKDAQDLYDLGANTFVNGKAYWSTQAEFNAFRPKITMSISGDPSHMGMEEARMSKMPPFFYDYTPEALRRRMMRDAYTLTRIESFGQSGVPGVRDEFEKFADRMNENQGYSQQQKLAAKASAQWLSNEINQLNQHGNVLATMRAVTSGLMTGNPFTSAKVGISRFFYTVQNAGIINTTKALFETLSDIKKSPNDARALGILGDMQHITNEDIGLRGTYYDNMMRLSRTAIELGGHGVINRWANIVNLQAEKNWTTAAITSLRRDEAAGKGWSLGTRMAAEKVERRGLGLTLQDLASEADRMESDQARRDAGEEVPMFGQEKTKSYWRRAVTDTQTSYNIMDLPGWSKTPIGKMIFQFQPWAFNTSRMLLKELVNPAIGHFGDAYNARKAGDQEAAQMHMKMAGLYLGRSLMWAGAGGVVGGEALNWLQHLFGRSTMQTGLGEFLGRLSKQEDGHKIFASVLHRAMDDTITGSFMGMTGDWAREIMNRTSHRNEVAHTWNPLDTSEGISPVLGLLEQFTGLGMKLWQQGGHLSDEDMDHAITGMVSGFREAQNIGNSVAIATGAPFPGASEAKGRRDKQFVRSRVDEFYNAYPQLDNRDLGEVHKGRNSYARVFMDNIDDALFAGDPMRAKAIFADMVKKTGLKKAEAMLMVKANIQSQQPLPQGKTSLQLFGAWARKNLSDEENQRTQLAQKSFTTTASRAGFIKSSDIAKHQMGYSARGQRLNAPVILGDF